MSLVRENATLKLAAAALAFIATFAVVRAIDEGGAVVIGVHPGVGQGLRPSATTAQRIEVLQSDVQRSPSDPPAHVDLGQAYLTRFGETEDPRFYPRAQHEFETALTLEPDDPSAVASMAKLQLSRHQFPQGLALAERARSLNPATVQIDALITDGQVELGRYGAAARTLQHYVDRRPELGSYARISYLRELHGDVRGAVRAMELAAAAAGEQSANAAYANTLLGKLHADQGDYARAAREFQRVLALKPGYPDAMLGLATIEFGKGQTQAALDRYRAVLRSVPAPDHADLLGEAEEAAGHRAAADRAYQVAREAFDAEAAQGANTATERALFEANHGDPAKAVELGRFAWHYTPSVRAADAYSWALSSVGRDGEALAMSGKAMRLGSRDPNFLYHGGIVALRAGQSERAHSFLARLVGQSPHFNPLYGPRAQRALSGLD